MEPVFTLDQLIADTQRAPAPTADDVCITNDGRRLDTREKLVAFFNEINAERSAEGDGGATGPTGG